MENAVPKRRKRGRPIGLPTGRSAWHEFIAARARLSISQKEAAERFGVSQQVLSEWETLHHAPPVRHWGSIADFMSVPQTVVMQQIADNFVTVLS